MHLWSLSYLTTCFMPLLVMGERGGVVSESEVFETNCCLEWVLTVPVGLRPSRMVVLRHVACGAQWEGSTDGAAHWRGLRPLGAPCALCS